MMCMPGPQRYRVVTLFQARCPECRISRIAIKDNLQLINHVSRQVSKIALVLGRNHDPFGPSIHGRLEFVRQRVDAHEHSMDREVSEDDELWHKGPREDG